MILIHVESSISRLYYKHYQKRNLKPPIKSSPKIREDFISFETPSFSKKKSAARSNGISSKQSEMEREKVNAFQSNSKPGFSYRYHVARYARREREKERARFIQAIKILGIRGLDACSTNK